MEKLLKESALDLKNRNARSIVKRLPEMLALGEIAKGSGDKKQAFIYLKRWLNCVEWIKKTPAYRKEKSFYDAYISINEHDKVKKLFAEVENEIKALYATNSSELKNVEPSGTEKQENGSNKFTADSGVMNLPETPTDEPLVKESEDFMSCHQLYTRMKNSQRYLIIDMRTKEDYKESRIKSDRCINLPADLLKSGVLAGNYEALYKNNPTSLRLYQHRGREHVDEIILLDWTTTSQTLFPGNKISLLKNVLLDWDWRQKPAKVRILDGGYADWLNRYPTLVTNPGAQVPTSQDTAMEEILEDVQYPDWLNSDDSPFQTLRIQPAKKKEFNTNRQFIDESTPKNDRKYVQNDNEDSEVPAGNSLATRKNPYKIATNKMSEMTHKNNRKLISDNQEIEAMSTDDEQVNFVSNNKLPNESTLYNTITNKPRIDRSSKPTVTTAKKRHADISPLLKLQEQHLALLKEQERIENQLHIHELDYHNLDNNYNRGANDSHETRRSMLQAQLESDSKILVQLQSKKDQVKDALKKQMLLTEKLSISPSDQAFLDKIQLNIGSVMQRLKHISMDRKALREKIMNTKRPRTDYGPNSLLENGITKEPLKSDGSSANTGLKRSHSSPNLAQKNQLDNAMTPLVDRSSKPLTPLAQIPSRSKGNANSKLTWKDREQRMEPVFRDTRPGITGLKNLGNSCYMNSIIQCLSNNIRMAKYFNEDAYLDDLNRSISNSKKGLVADEVAHVIKALWRGQYKSISPHDLRVVIGQYRLQFDSNEQQDSHEFLVFLLEWLHNDLKKGDDIYLEDMSIAKKLWFKEIGNGESIISELFIGQLRSSIICSTCKNSSITYETFNSLTLSLPTARCTLDECVEKYLTGQKVSGWTCEHCKVPRDATKKFDFIKLPPTVVIHLNRFAESEGWLQKSNVSVDFPLSDFNLGSYLVDDTDSRYTQSKYDFSRMSLYAVSAHYGNMTGGHYTAFCQNVGQHKWYKYDDQIVSEVSSSEVKNQGPSAYLLFYTTMESESYPYIPRGQMMKLGRF